MTMPDISAAVEQKSITPLSERLLRPAMMHSLNTLLAHWFDQTIHLRLEGAGALVDHPALLNNMRRSFGAALGRGASDAARKGRPCPWGPPCALDVFFREQLRSGGQGLPKPFVVRADRDGADLIASLRVFGFAADWLLAVESAFIDGLRTVLPWPKLGGAVPNIVDRRIETCEGINSGTAPAGVVLEWRTPLDTHRLDVMAAPWSIFTRLLRRTEGLARWCDTDLDTNEEALEACCRALDYDMTMAQVGTAEFWSGRDQKLVRQAAMRGQIRISGDVGALWPLLQIGQCIHAGRGAAQGQGRFNLRSLIITHPTPSFHSDHQKGA